MPENVMPENDIRFEVVLVKEISRVDPQGYVTVTGTPRYLGSWSKFPTRYRYCLDSEITEHKVAVNEVATLKLRRGRQKDDRDGSDPQKDYWWDALAIRGGDVVTGTPHESASATASPQEAAGATEGRSTSFEDGVRWGNSVNGASRLMAGSIQALADSGDKLADFEALVRHIFALAPGTPGPPATEASQTAVDTGQGEEDGDDTPSDIREQEGGGSPQGEPPF